MKKILFFALWSGIFLSLIASDMQPIKEKTQVNYSMNEIFQVTAEGKLSFSPIAGDVIEAAHWNVVADKMVELNRAVDEGRLPAFKSGEITIPSGFAPCYCIYGCCFGGYCIDVSGGVFRLVECDP